MNAATIGAVLVERSTTSLSEEKILVIGRAKTPNTIEVNKLNIIVITTQTKAEYLASDARPAPNSFPIRTDTAVPIPNGIMNAKGTICARIVCAAKAAVDMYPAARAKTSKDLFFFFDKVCVEV